MAMKKDMYHYTTLALHASFTKRVYVCMHIMQIQDINKTQSTTGMLFPKSKIQRTEYEDARKKKIVITWAR